MTKERRFHAGECEVRAGGDDTPVIAGYAAVFNSYSQNLGGFVERVDPAAFNKTIAEADVRALFNHDDSLVLGRNRSGTLRLATDEHGLAYEIDVNPRDPDHTRVVAKIERGDVTGSSFGFRVIEDDWGVTEQDFPLRTLRQVALYDVSPVTYPAYTDTEAGMKRAALRSLAELSGRAADELVACGPDELRALILADQAEEDEQPGEQPTAAPDALAPLRRHLLLTGAATRSVASRLAEVRRYLEHTTPSKEERQWK